MHDDLDDDYGLAGAIAGLADEVYLFEQAQAARAMIAKAEQAERDSADAMLATLAKQAGDPAPLIAGADLAALGRLAQRAELRERVARHLSVGQTPDPTRLPWQVNATTASVDEHVSALERLAACG